MVHMVGFAGYRFSQKHCPQYRRPDPISENKQFRFAAQRIRGGRRDRRVAGRGKIGLSQTTRAQGFRPDRPAIPAAKNGGVSDWNPAFGKE